jgi:hypothetical protein
MQLLLQHPQATWLPVDGMTSGRLQGRSHRWPSWRLQTHCMTTLVLATTATGVWLCMAAVKLDVHELHRSHQDSTWAWMAALKLLDSNSWVPILFCSHHGGMNGYGSPEHQVSSAQPTDNGYQSAAQHDEWRGMPNGHGDGHSKAHRGRGQDDAAYGSSSNPHFAHGLGGHEDSQQHAVNGVCTATIPEDCTTDEATHIQGCLLFGAAWSERDVQQYTELPKPCVHAGFRQQNGAVAAGTPPRPPAMGFRQPQDSAARPNPHSYGPSRADAEYEVVHLCS